MSTTIDIPRGNTLSGDPARKLLQIGRVEQSMSEWCFAACGEMISKYLALNTTQCLIANNYLKGFGSCNDACQNPSLCNAPCQIQKISNLYKKFGISSTYIDRPAEGKLIMQEVFNAQRPILALLTYMAGGSHVILITGWQPNGPHGPMVYAIDTRKNYGEGWYDYSAILQAQNAQGAWVGSWVGISRFNSA
jgi:hypothetical protein